MGYWVEFLFGQPERKDLLKPGAFFSVVGLFVGLGIAVLNVHYRLTLPYPETMPLSKAMQLATFPLILGILFGAILGAAFGWVIGRKVPALTPARLYRCSQVLFLTLSISGFVWCLRLISRGAEVMNVAPFLAILIFIAFQQTRWRIHGFRDTRKRRPVGL